MNEDRVKAFELAIGVLALLPEDDRRRQLVAHEQAGRTPVDVVEKLADEIISRLSKA